MVWEKDPVVALEELAEGGAQPLTARPHVLCAPGLRASLGSIAEGVAGDFGSHARMDFELELHDCLLTACNPHVYSLTPAGGQQGVGSHSSACSLRFRDNTESDVRRQALADEGCIALQTSEGLVHVPVRAEAGRVPTECAQVTVHGLPAEFNVVGVIHTVLACAGYDRNVLVRAEFAGELPATLAASYPEVVRGDIAVGVVRLPQGDSGLKHLPRRFYDHGNDMTFRITVASHLGVRCRVGDRSPSSLHDGAPGATSPPRQRRRRDAHRQRRLPASPAPVSSEAAQGGSSGPLHSLQGTLLRPLDAVTDLGGQFDRRGIGRPAHPPGFPPTARFPAAGGSAT